MNYEEMSDYEINRAVAACFLPCDYEPSDESETVFLLGPTGYAEWKSCGKFDPCNNPSDAWPIIEWIFNEGLAIVMNNEGVMTSVLGKRHNHQYFDLEGDPLRCCMIVYLMMQEVE